MVSPELVRVARKSVISAALFLRFRGLNPEFAATLFTESTYMR